MKTSTKKNARFPPQIWNQSDNFGCRTNNHVEGWHYSFNRRVGRAHPNLWVFIQNLMDQDRTFRRLVSMQNSGSKVVKKSTKYQKIDERIYRIRMKYENNELDSLELIDSIKYIEF